MKVKTSTRQKFYEVTKEMPPLYHSIPGEKFDIRKSRVIWWLIKQPEILSYLFNIAQHCDGIFYNNETGKWQGVDYDGYEDN